MDRRSTLIKLVSGAFSLLLLAFIWVLFKGISFTDNSTKKAPTNNIDHNTHPLYKGLVAGQSALRRYKGRVVWVTYFTPQMNRPLSALDAHVSTLHSDCEINNSNTFCVLNAATNISGVYIQFTQQPPQQLPSNVPWHGGLVNPTNGDVYDLYGRAYKINKSDKPNLSVIKVTF